MIDDSKIGYNDDKMLISKFKEKNLSKINSYTVIVENYLFIVIHCLTEYF